MSTEQSRPAASTLAVERRMKNQRRRDTAAEMALRRELFRRGLRYRVDLRVAGKRGRVDIAFTRAKIAVFVDGCFWHSCPEHSTIPKANRDWWSAKLEANERRDRIADAQLIEMGWVVVRVWEHEGVGAAANRVERVVRGRRSGGSERVDVAGDVVQEALLKSE